MPDRRIVTGLLIALVLGACGADGGDRASSLLGRPEETARPVAAQGAQGQEPAARRAVVYTAAIRVSAGDVAGASRQAVEVAERVGGFLFRQDSDLVGSEKATLVFKVPPEQFQQVLTELGELGRVLDRSVQADDVTDQVVDLEGRLGTARASIGRLQGFLAEARNVGEVASLEAELARRESEAESLEGRLRVLRSTVDLATVTVRLVERTSAEPSDDLPGFLQGLRSGWVTLVTTARVILAVSGFLTPFVPPAVLVGLAVRRYRRRRRAQRPPGPSGPPGGQVWPDPPPSPSPEPETVGAAGPGPA